MASCCSAAFQSPPKACLGQTSSDKCKNRHELVSSVASSLSEESSTAFDPKLLSVDLEALRDHDVEFAACATGCPPLIVGRPPFGCRVLASLQARSAGPVLEVVGT